MKLVANQTLDLSSTTFRTEADAIVAAKPDVILTEALGPTDAAFLSEVKQLNGGKMIPVIGTSATISPDWFKSVSAAVGASTLAPDFWADNLVDRDAAGPRSRRSPRRSSPRRARSADRRLLDVPDRAGGGPSVRRDQPGGAGDDRSRRAPLDGLQGRTSSRSATACRARRSCYSFAQGVAALKAGKQIRYEGPGGPTSFDAYHDSAGLFQVDTYTLQGRGQGRRQHAPTSQLGRSASECELTAF